MPRFRQPFPANAVLLFLFSSSAFPLIGQVAGIGINKWTATASMQVPRADACSAVLADGRVLVAGGSGAAGAAAMAEVYGSDGTFAVATPMRQPRTGAACATLADGRVLVAGGSAGETVLDTAEIYNAATDTWTAAATMATPRTGHRAVLTPWGSVLIAGGRNGDTVTGRVELYLPQVDRFEAIGTLSSSRTDYAAAILPGRRILLAGGTDGQTTLTTVEIYDSNTGKVTPAGEMLRARKNFAATTLLDGTVLMAGGYDADGNLLVSTEIFDPGLNVSIPGPDLAVARAGHLAYALPDNGAVLLAGGTGSGGALSSAELYVPSLGAMKPAASMGAARLASASGVRRPGSLVVAGGRNASAFLASSELYRFATVRTDKPDYAPGETAVIAGSGWTPGEQVLISVAAFPLDSHAVEFTGVAAADGRGDIRLDGFKIDRSHRGMSFLMTATGSESLAQTLFTDNDATQIDPSVTTIPASPAVFGTAVELKGTVSDTATPASIPTGTVTITLNGAAVNGGASVALDATGAFDFHFDGSTQFLHGVIGGASNSILITYNGDGSHSASAAMEVKFEIDAVAIPWSVVFSPTPPSPGQPLSITVSNPAIGGTAIQGGVRLCLGATCPWNVLPSAYQTLVWNPASAVSSFTFTIPGGLTSGTYNIGVQFGGSASFQMLTDFQSGVITPKLNIVVPDPTTTTLTASPSSSVFTQPVLFTATVTDTLNAAKVINGTVDFFDNGTKVATIAVTTPNQAQFSTSALAFGSHSLSATYNGDAATAPSSGTASFSVSAAATTAAASVADLSNASISTSVWGQQVVVKATVTAQPPATGTPSDGTVQFSDGASAIGSPVTVSAGAASVTVTPGSVGVHAYTTQYLGNGTGYAASTSSFFNLTVNQAATAVSTPALTSGTAVFGNTLTFSVTVTPVAPGAGTPTGTVTFKDGPTTIGTGSPNGPGVWTLTISTLTVGSHSITAVYGGDTDFLGSTSSALNQPVSTATTSTSTPVKTAGTATYGNQLTFSATVTSAGGTPTGTITFFDGANNLGSGTVNGSGTATFTTTVFLSGGSHSITATYNTDGNFATSTSAALTQIIDKAGTSVSAPVLSSGTPAYGNTLSFSATVTSTAGTPTGTITFFDGATNLGSGTVNGSGTATISTAVLSGGSHSITATYNTDGNFATSTSAALTQIIDKAGTSVSAPVLSSGTPAYGNTLSFSATVTSTAGTPTGTITFFDGATNIGVGTVNGSGAATISTAVLSVGSHSITATYNADTNFATSTSTALTQSVSKASTNVTVTSSTVAGLPPGQSVVFGQAVVLSAAFTSAGTGPSGTVNLVDSATSSVLCSATIAAGAATCTAAGGIAGLGVTTHSVAVTYAGDTNYSVGTVTPLAFAIAKAATSVGAPVLAGGTPTFGQALTFSSTVSAVAPGSGTRTGTVTFSDGSTAIGTGAVNASGTATITISTLTAGTHSISAAYGGDGNFLASASGTLSQNVGLASSNVSTPALTSGSATPGSSMTFSSTVTGGSGSGVPGGTITFTVDGTARPAVAINAAGSASVTLTLASGSHTVSAAYSGDANFQAATSGTLTQSVSASNTNPPSGSDSSLTAFVNPSPPTVGQLVTFTVSVVSNGSGPAGTVRLYDGTTLLGTGQVVGGQANLTTTFTSAGGHNMVLTYAADGTTTVATTSFGVQVTRIPLTLVLTSNLPASTYGQPVTLTAKVATQSPAGVNPPSGAIQLLDGATVVATGPLAQGAAILNVAGLNAGAHQVTASFAGDANWFPATATAVTQSVAKAHTALTLDALPDVSAPAPQVTVTATVGVAAPGGGIPDGTVQFVDTASNLVLGTSQVVGGTAKATLTEPGEGSRTITAIFADSPNYVGSKSPDVTHISIANAASYSAYHASPDQIMSIFGANLASGSASASTLPLPVSLAGSSVKITDQAGIDHPAQLYFASATQVNLLIPSDVPLGPVRVTVTNASGDSFPIVTAATSTAPGLFAANANGRGIAAAQVVRVSPSGGTPAVENVAKLDPVSNTFVAAPISFGTDQLFLTLYGTGIRHTPGQGSVTCTINGQSVPILFAGAQPVFVGLDQVNVQLPGSLAGTGQATVVIQVDGHASNAVNLVFQ